MSPAQLHIARAVGIRKAAVADPRIHRRIHLKYAPAAIVGLFDREDTTNASLGVLRRDHMAPLSELD